MFERSCYVGYTATPFANIFIDPDSEDEMLGEDLFPRHFIVSLDPPSNYFGPQKVFLEDSEAIIRYIDDSEDLLPLKHPKETTVDTLPPSLVTAVRSFIVARAIRLARGHENQHCSMLVNVSRFTDVQRQIRNLIHNKLVEIQASARTYAALPKEAALASPEILSLYEVWKKEFEATGTKWQTIQERLNQASAPVAVIEVNSKSSDRLNYEDYKDSGLSVIAVGGFSLSRGLTLEGLLISYFLRNSMMYDTLMQMGRWFGYRPDYSDLCRVWMLEEAEGWYSHIAESIEILREDLRSMEAAGGTPEDFGLKVRSHPYNLIITARNKIGSGEKVILRIGLANNFIETATLKPDPESLSRNRKVLITLVDNLSKSGLPVSQSQQLSSGWLLQKVHSRPVIRFLEQFQNHEGSLLTDPRLVIPYIEDRCDDELSEWDIFFPSVNKDVNNRIVDNSLGIRIVCQQRPAGNKSDPSTLLITNKQRVASRGVEKVGLSKDSIEKAQQDFKKNKPDNLNFPDKIYRKERKRPLLIIHLLTILEPRLEMNFEEPVVAWSISFPTTNYEGKRVEYVVNTTWLKENFKYDLEEEEISGDD